MPNAGGSFGRVVGAVSGPDRWAGPAVSLGRVIGQGRPCRWAVVGQGCPTEAPAVSLGRPVKRRSRAGRSSAVSLARRPTRYNADMSHRQTRQFCVLDNECSNLLKGAMTEMGLSARAHDKILRVARTIADLDNSDGVKPHHLNEAINYRMLDRNLWT